MSVDRLRKALKTNQLINNHSEVNKKKKERREYVGDMFVGLSITVAESSRIEGER